MNKYLISWQDSDKNTGGVKAKADVEKIMQHHGYELIKVSASKIGKLWFAYCSFPRMISKLTGVILVQFPTGTPTIQKKIVETIKKNRKLKLVFLIHDIETLRLNSDGSNTKDIGIEKELLLQADGIISLNPKMTDWFRSIGIKCPITNLNVWDYLNDVPLENDKKYEGSICFAGNLGKSTFLEKLKLKRRLHLLGPNPKEKYPENIIYEGQYTPNEIASRLTQNFGLVWDGTSTTTCDGVYGSYLRYNTPHKISLYLSSGIPVIVWKEAAIAEFIANNNVGITVSSLDELDKVLDTVTVTDYKVLRENSIKIAKKLRRGSYLLSAEEELLKSIGEKSK